MCLLRGTDWVFVYDSECLLRGTDWLFVYVSECLLHGTDWVLYMIRNVFTARYGRGLCI